MIATTISILFVDFKVYPRCLGKTEEYGISLMDIGTGSILLVSGTMYAVIESNLKMLNILGKERTIISRILTATKHSVLVILIGVIRPILLKFFNYQEHVTEYGTHWNFFLTIAFVTISCCLLPQSLEKRAHYIGLGIMMLYEIACSPYVLDLKGYMLSNAPRVSMLDKNKEGIFQCLGYLSCYFIGVFYGELYKKLTIQRRCTNIQLFFGQFFYCLVLLIVFLAYYYFVDNSSRRLVLLECNVL